MAGTWFPQVGACLEQCQDGFESADGRRCTAVVVSRKKAPFTCYRRADVQLEKCVAPSSDFDTWLVS
jgi:hypothetical protein